MSEVKIKVNNLYKIFGSHANSAMKLLKDGLSNKEILKKTKCGVGVAEADFEVYSGEILVVMGLSGSGKSTLLRCLNRLINPTEGEVLIDGVDIAKMEEEELRSVRRHKFGMVFQRFALFPHRTILDNVGYGLEIQKVEKNERIEKSKRALEMVGLKGWDNSYPEQLSGGMQQRVGLARALAIDPDILLMDEAFSALDPLIRTEMQDELIQLQSKMQKTILFITHDLDEALKMGDRIILMKDGRIVQIGSPEEILTNPANQYVEKFLENVDFTKVLTSSDVMVKPKTLGFYNDGPVTILHRMKKEGLSGIFIVDRAHKLMGYVTAEEAGKAAKSGQKYIHDIIIKYQEQKVGLDVPVRKLFKVIVDNRYPIAVIDDDDVLKGIIVKGSIIAGLAERGEFNDED